MPVSVAKASNSKLGWNITTRQELADYLADAMELLRLADVELTVDLAVPSEECAEIAIDGGQRRATLHLAKDFLAHPPRWQQETLLHELLHLHFNPLAELSTAALDGAADTAVARVLSNVLYAQLEFPVDMLASAFADVTAPPAFSVRRSEPAQSGAVSDRRTSARRRAPRS